MISLSSVLYLLVPFSTSFFGGHGGPFGAIWTCSLYDHLVSSGCYVSKILDQMFVNIWTIECINRFSEVFDNLLLVENGKFVCHGCVFVGLCNYHSRENLVGLLYWLFEG